MTESEVIEALSEISLNAATYMTVFILITFAYLTVAYLVGRSLTKFQCWVVAVLYALTSTMFGVAAVGFTETWQRLREREESIFDEIWIH
ncbi:MAG: hypothetical protein ACU84Q_01530 [Gammaproteobacteria bacterium]